MKKVIASILTIVLSINIFLSTPLANTVSQSNTTGYGSYYFTYNNDLDTFLLTLGNLGGVNMKGYCQSLIYEFNDTYSGYLDIHLLSESIWNNATIITENCYVKGKNSSTHDYSIGFKDVTSIKVTIVLPTLTTNNAWSGNKMALTTNYNISRDINTAEDYLENIDTTMGQIDAELSTMQQSLSQILTVEQATRQLLSEIETALRGNNSLYVLSDDMGTIIYDLNSIISNIASIRNELIMNNVPYYSKTAFALFNGYADNLTLNYDPNVMLYYYNLNSGMEVVNNKNTVVIEYGKPIDLIFMVKGLSLNNQRFSHYSMNYNSWYRFLLIGQYGPYYIYKIQFYVSDNTNYSYDYTGIKFELPYPVYPLYLGIEENIPVELNSMFNTFIQDRYTLRLEAIRDAINNMSLNVNQLTVNATGITYNVNNTQVDNSVTTYNTNINQVYNVENNFGTQLNTQLQNYNPDNTSIISRLAASSNIMATVLNGINGIELFTVPISIMLVGIVLLAIVG